MTTPNLQLPEVPQAIESASDEINAGFHALDALVQLSVLSRTTTSPPANSVQGDRYIVPDDAIGPWASRKRAIAYLSPTGWIYYRPRRGWLAWVPSESALYYYSGTQWTLWTPPGSGDGGGEARDFELDWVVKEARPNGSGVPQVLGMESLTISGSTTIANISDTNELTRYTHYGPRSGASMNVAASIRMCQRRSKTDPPPPK